MNLDILFGCHIAFPVIANRHSARTGLHGHSALLRLYSLAYCNIAILSAHGQILLHRQIIAKGDVPLFFRLCVERALGLHIIRHQQIAVFGNQIHVVSGVQFSVIRKSDVFAVRDIVLPYRFDRNVRCGSLALDQNLSFICLQRHILFRGNSIILRTIASDADIPLSGGNFDVSFLRRYGLHNLDLSIVRLDGHIAILGQHIAVITCIRVAYGDISGKSGNNHIILGCDILSYPDSAFVSMKAYRSVRRGNSFPYLDVPFVRRNIHVILNTDIRAKINIPLFRDIDLNTTVRGLDSFRNPDIAVTTVQGDVATGNQCTVIPDDEVSGIRSRLIAVLSGCHRNVAICRGGLALNGNGSKTGFDCNILFRRYRLLLRNRLPFTFSADFNTAFARFHGYTFILGLDRSGNEDIALAGTCNKISFLVHLANICNNVVFGDNTTIN